MGNFNKRDRFGGKNRFDDNRERSQMHKAVCAECGKSCEVPFRPTGDKPVYCSDCFSKRDGSGGGRFDRRDSGQKSFGNKQMFEAVCDKCHKKCEVPFRPTGDKPVYCSDCFGRGEKGSGGNTGGSDQYKKQFEMLNNKLDNILRILSPKITTEKIVKEEKPIAKIVKKDVAKKVEAKKAAAPKKVTKKVIVKKKK